MQLKKIIGFRDPGADIYDSPEVNSPKQLVHGSNRTLHESKWSEVMFCQK